jgi:hypothetical protein
MDLFFLQAVRQAAAILVTRPQTLHYSMQYNCLSRLSCPVPAIFAFIDVVDFLLITSQTALYTDC